jgi:hypothetical protein
VTEPWIEFVLSIDEVSSTPQEWLIEEALLIAREVGMDVQL